MRQAIQPGCASVGPCTDRRISSVSGRCFADGMILRVEITTPSLSASSVPELMLSRLNTPMSLIYSELHTILPRLSETQMRRNLDDIPPFSRNAVLFWPSELTGLASCYLLAMLPMYCLSAPRNSHEFLGADRQYSRGKEGARRRHVWAAPCRRYVCAFMKLSTWSHGHQRPTPPEAALAAQPAPLSFCRRCGMPCFCIRL